MSKTLIYFFENYIYFLIIITNANLFLKRRNIGNIKKVINGVFFSLFVTFAYIVIKDEYIKLIINFLAILLIVEFNYYVEKKINKLLCSLLLMSFISFSNYMIGTTIEMLIFRKLYNDVDIISILIQFILVYGVWKFILKEQQIIKKNIPTKYYRIAIVLFCLDTIDIIILAYVFESFENIRKNVAFAIIMIKILSIIFQLALLVFLIISRNNYRDKMIIERKYAEEQKEHYKDLDESRKELRKYIHDYKNHQILLSQLLHQKKYEQADEYLKTIINKIDDIEYTDTVMNNTLDAVLYKYKIDTKRKGIDFVVKGHYPENEKMDTYDICTIFSNLIDNAIQAEVESGKKSIIAQFKYDEKELFFSLENDYLHIVKDDNGKFETTKGDYDSHGMGLEIVRECVKKYNGQIEYYINEEQKKFKVLLSVNYLEGR